MGYRGGMEMKLKHEFNAATGTLAQRRAKCVDAVCSRLAWRRFRIQAEEFAATLT